jgi:hypothetical protein
LRIAHTDFRVQINNSICLCSDDLSMGKEALKTFALGRWTSPLNRGAGRRRRLLGLAPWKSTQSVPTHSAGLMGRRAPAF